MARKLILASTSPRRQALLEQVKMPFTVRTANIDESKVTTNDPIEKVKCLAVLKGRNVLLKGNDEVVLSADTVVAYNDRIFEKPKTKTDARKMMSVLSGKIHEVFTGVMIRTLHKEVIFVERTEVEFWPLTKEEIESYIETDEPYDKAGGYGIQSVGAQFVKQINGDYYNVVGLPLSKVIRELRKVESFDKTNKHP